LDLFQPLNGHTYKQGKCFYLKLSLNRHSFSSIQKKPLFKSQKRQGKVRMRQKNL